MSSVSPVGNIKTLFRNTLGGVREIGERAYHWCGKQNANFDTFVSKKGFNPKTVKQIGLGAVVTAAIVTLAGLSIKGIVNKIKDVNEKK